MWQVHFCHRRDEHREIFGLDDRVLKLRQDLARIRPPPVWVNYANKVIWKPFLVQIYKHVYEVSVSLACIS